MLKMGQQDSSEGKGACAKPDSLSGSLEPLWCKERTDSSKLSSDLKYSSWNIFGHTCTRAHTYTINKCNKIF